MKYFSLHPIIQKAFFATLFIAGSFPLWAQELPQKDKSGINSQTVESPLVNNNDNNSIVIANPGQPTVRSADLYESRKFRHTQYLPMNVFPNPATSEVRILFTSRENGQDYRLVMMSADGKPLQEKKGTTIYGENQVRLDINSYPTGFYYVQLITKAGRQEMRLLKNAR